MANVSRSYASNADLVAKYEPLKLPDNAVQVTYVWIDACEGLRSKSKTIDFIPKSVEEVPVWNFGIDYFYNSQLPPGSEINMLPVSLYNDPFSGGNSKLVLCQGVHYEKNKPIEANTRHLCLEAMNLAAAQEPRFIIEQEYCIWDGNQRNCYKPLGWPDGGLPAARGPYFCGVGALSVVGRDVVEAHYRACMYAGVHILGESAGNMLAQWKFEIGPSKGISICDDLWMARYLLLRVAEDFHIGITFDPKLFPHQTGDGSKVYFSTKAMQQNGNFEIESAIDKLQKSYSLHKLQFSGYPFDMARRCALESANSSANQIPVIVTKEDCLYLQDRRPPSNMDPYIVCQQMVRSICLNT